MGMMGKVKWKNHCIQNEYSGLAPLEGFEPSTFTLGGCCSILLSYNGLKKGYSTQFHNLQLCKGGDSTGHKKYGHCIPSAPDRIRTCDLRIRSPWLFPAELQGLYILFSLRTSITITKETHVCQIPQVDMGKERRLWGIRDLFRSGRCRSFMG